MSKEKILVTGAATGFGKGIVCQLAQQGKDVIAAVETYSQVSQMSLMAKAKGIKLQIEKLDVTDEGDRRKAWQWDVGLLVNNAAVAEGGSVVDIPCFNLHRQFEVNVIGPILLTQGFAKKMIKEKEGKIIFMSSVLGLSTDPFGGAYSASKHAVEAFAEALHKELQEFKVQVVTINPGPYLTGFNDRMLETYKSWIDNPEDRVFDYSKIAFPHMQLDPQGLIDEAVKVINGDIKTYRNVIPKAYISMVKKQMDEAWEREIDDKQGKMDDLVKVAYAMKPGTPAEK